MIASAPEPAGLDEEARTELLCYLAVGQLVAHARTGEWLRTDHLVESARIWLAGNGASAKANWSDRVRLGGLSEKVARDFAKLPRFADTIFLAKLFTDGWRLDYRSPVVRGIHAACEGELSRHT